jgi:hypothetical protein
MIVNNTKQKAQRDSAKKTSRFGLNELQWHEKNWFWLIMRFHNGKRLLFAGYPLHLQLSATRVPFDIAFENHLSEVLDDEKLRHPMPPTILLSHALNGLVT